ncbi:Dna polymerase [Thalictrum thalictroides]|uniref:DNA-directed DNA polymerase n=1 Tax=Thalictrum thalictroides TaxID=46969 RepID=A0A7J6W4M8_THATH|nr:Dna polymerase [Thalictrum thalictroides]
MFEKKESPFVDFVNDLYEKRLEAKRLGQTSLVFGYKLIMNSLYGRFGINPLKDDSIICEEEEYNGIWKNNKDFVGADQISSKYYLVSIKRNPENFNWSPPSISAVQLSAAITACARIHMYPIISRDDCYYTDTDSAVLGNPLSKEDISSTVLGLLKLEYKVKEGYFLAPKSYMLQPVGKADSILIHEEGYMDPIIKHKGVAKSLVTPEWFKQQYNNMYEIINDNKYLQSPVLYETARNFYIDYKKMIIYQKIIKISLRTRPNTKREAQFNKERQWIDTSPKSIRDYCGQERIVIYLKEDLYDCYKKQQEEMNRVRQSDTPLPEDRGKSTQSNTTEVKLTLYKPKNKPKRQPKPMKREGKKPP